MKHTYSGNIKSLSSLVEGINRESGSRFLPHNDITRAKLKNDRLEMEGLFCKSVGRIEPKGESVNIDLKVRVRWYFAFIGLFLLVFLSGFIWGENVTINGDSNPSIWKRLVFVSLGLGLFSIPFIMLRKAREDFKKKTLESIKSTFTNKN